MGESSQCQKWEEEKLCSFSQLPFKGFVVQFWAESTLLGSLGLEVSGRQTPEAALLLCYGQAAPQAPPPVHGSHLQPPASPLLCCSTVKLLVTSFI